MVANLPIRCNYFWKNIYETIHKLQIFHEHVFSVMKRYSLHKTPFNDHLNDKYRQI